MGFTTFGLISFQIKIKSKKGQKSPIDILFVDRPFEIFDSVLVGIIRFVIQSTPQDSVSFYCQEQNYCHTPISTRCLFHLAGLAGLVALTRRAVTTVEDTHAIQRRQNSSSSISAVYRNRRWSIFLSVARFSRP